MKQRLVCLAVASIFLLLFLGNAFASASFAVPTKNALINLIAEVKGGEVIATAQCLYDNVGAPGAEITNGIRFSLFGESGILAGPTDYLGPCTKNPSNFGTTFSATTLTPGKVYSIKAEIMTPCTICEKQAFFSIPETPKGTIPDNNGIAVAIVLALVLAMIVSARKKKK